MLALRVDLRSPEVARALAQAHDTSADVCGTCIEKKQAMKVWSFNEWLALLSRARFARVAAQHGASFAPPRVAQSLEGQHVVWQQHVISPSNSQVNPQ